MCFSPSRWSAATSKWPKQEKSQEERRRSRLSFLCAQKATKCFMRRTTVSLSTSRYISSVELCCVKAWHPAWVVVSKVRQSNSWITLVVSAVHPALWLEALSAGQRPEQKLWVHHPQPGESTLQSENPLNLLENNGSLKCWFCCFSSLKKQKLSLLRLTSQSLPTLYRTPKRWVN